MAKLNVEVLDMVNGEITKIAYKGAEYAKVDGIVKKGDIAVVVEAWGNQKAGEFYFVDKAEYDYKGRGRNYVTIVKGNPDECRAYDTDMKYFRKISADKPTLEQRVETLESDVAALKGEKKSANTFKIGDTIKVIRNTASWGKKEKAGYHVGGQGVVKVGAIGEVTSVSGDFVTAKFAYGDVNGDSQRKKELRFDEIELAEETIEFEGATYRKVEREAREGDVVIFSEEIASKTSYVTANKPYKVTLNPKGRTVFNTDGVGTYNVYRNNGYNRTHETVDVYEPIEQAKKVASEPKLKAGDYVKFKRSIDDTKAGKPYLIEYYAERGELAFRDDAGDWCSIAHTGEYEILSAEEAKWAKIGRKPNEFKKGDVVRVVDNMGVSVPIGSLATITHDQIDDKPKAKAVSTRNGDLRSFWLGVELITPVESLFNNA